MLLRQLAVVEVVTIAVVVVVVVVVNLVFVDNANEME
jgi:hypothetical protein